MTKTPKASAIPPGTATITVSCAGAGAPLVVRVRRAAKVLLRAYGLRAERIDLRDVPEREGGGV